MLDYGGGYGLFVRMMRDRGYEFYRQDSYCENLFAKHFDHTDISENHFDLLTSFEVFEHFENPMHEIEKMFKLSSTIIFSTVLIPSVSDAELENWWYLSEETGQHLAFYSLPSLKVIAERYDKKLYSNGHNLHILTNATLSDRQLSMAFKF